MKNEENKPQDNRISASPAEPALRDGATASGAITRKCELWNFGVLQGTGVLYEILGAPEGAIAVVAMDTGFLTSWPLGAVKMLPKAAQAEHTPSASEDADIQDETVASRPAPVSGTPSDETLLKIQHKLKIMLASATALDDGDCITGYQIKCGAMHAILGIMAGAGYSVTIPLPSAPAGEVVARPDLSKLHIPNPAELRNAIEKSPDAKFVMLADVEARFAAPTIQEG